MSSGLSETSIYGLAADYLEETPITSPEDNSVPARFFKRNYATMRDSLLRLHPWNFALDRQSLPEDSTSPAFGWDHKYPVLATWLRVLPPTETGELDGKRVLYRLESGNILCNKTSPLKAIGVRRVVDPNEFDTLFGVTLAAALALKAAHLITGKTSFTEKMQEIYADTLDSARMIDSLEGGTADYPIDDEFEEARNSF